jgi:uncharacterized protein
MPANRPAVMVIAMLAAMGGAARLYAGNAPDPIAYAERALGFARGQVFDLDSNDTVADAWVVGTRSDCIGLGHCSSSCVEVRVAQTNYNGSFAFDTLRGIENFEQHLYLDGYVQDFRRPVKTQTDAGLKKAEPNETYGEPDPITGRIAFLTHDAVLMYCGSAPRLQRRALVPVYEAMFAEAWRIARYSEQKELARGLCTTLWEAKYGELMLRPGPDRPFPPSSGLPGGCSEEIQDPTRDEFLKALKDHDVSAVTRLVRAGFDPDRLIDGKQPAVMIATHENQPDLIKTLASLGAHIDHASRDRQTALSFMVTWRWRDGNPAPKLPAIGALLAAGADSALANEFGYSPFMYAVRQGDIEILDMMFEHGASASQQVGLGSTEKDSSALEIAVRYSRNPKLIELLIAHGADVNLSFKNGETPLMAALDNYERAAGTNKPAYEEIAEALVRAGAHLDVYDGAGRVVFTHTKDEKLKQRLRDLSKSP